MPYIHPTGVPCMTALEFFKKEADKEGRDPCDMMKELFDDIDADARKEEQAYSSRKKAMVFLRREIRQWNKQYPDEKVREVRKVINVISVKVEQTMRSHSLEIKVEAVDMSGKKGVLSYTESDSHGGYYDPPEGETLIDWEYQNLPVDNKDSLR